MRDKAHEAWVIATLSDDLLRMVTSHRQPENFFERRRSYEILSILRERMAEMAGRKKADAVRDTQKAEWQGFLERRLSDDELQALDEWKPKPSEVWSELDGMVAAGYRVTLTYNAREKSACATIIADGKALAWGGFALSSFDGDCALALKMAIFKHAVLLQRDWTPLMSPDAKHVRRG